MEDSVVQWLQGMIVQSSLGLDEDYGEEPEIELNPPTKKLKQTKDRVVLALKPIQKRGEVPTASSSKSKNPEVDTEVPLRRPSSPVETLHSVSKGNLVVPKLPSSPCPTPSSSSTCLNPL